METPYFVFKPKVLEKNYHDFQRLCEKYLKKFIIAYSVKTNTSYEVIEKLSELGSNFEVASLEEIEKTPHKSKIFNGPCKTKEELKIAIKQKFLINVDSRSELDKIAEILNGEKFNIGLRIAIKDSKFGFQPKDLAGIIRYSQSKNLNIIAVQLHSGTQKNLDEFKENLEIAESLIKKLNLKPKYIDIGSGFPDKIQLKNLGLSLEDYFIEIKRLSDEFDSTIILEPGRTLVADAFELITTVHYIKENFEKTYAILDVGINVLQRITLSQYIFSKIIDKTKIQITESPSHKNEYILAGPLLFSNDTFGKYIGNLKEGDKIRIENVGAYCYNLAWEISYKKPKIIIEE
jgi:diaminopimelate decarboxylase